MEFGCGLGYVTRWAASLGADATGIDLNEDNLAVAAQLAQEAGLENARFVSANIYEPGLEPESIDVAYSRWLMVHLNKPVEAMRAIYAALKPGGVMVCEEADVSAVYTEPSSAAYTELRDICMEGARMRGVDYSGGRRTHLWAKEAGFELVHGTPITRITWTANIRDSGAGLCTQWVWGWCEREAYRQVAWRSWRQE